MRAIGSAVHQVWTHFTATVIANIVAALLSIPLLVLLAIVSFAMGSVGFLPFGIALALGVLPNPASCGLQLIANELAHGEFVALSDQWDGLRQYWLVALRAWLLSLAVTIVIVANILFYATRHLLGPASLLLELIWIYLLVMWLILHLYVFPLLLEQEVKRVLTTYRNAFVLAVSRPGTSLVVTPLWLAVLFIGSVTGAGAFVLLAVGASIQCNATLGVIRTLRGSKPG